jgi:hypothetical protein
VGDVPDDVPYDHQTGSDNPKPESALKRLCCVNLSPLGRLSEIMPTNNSKHREKRKQSPADNHKFPKHIS